MLFAVDFILFGLTLLDVAVFHHKTLVVALAGLVAVTVYKLLFTGFREGEASPAWLLQLHHEWVILANLFLLLMGFAILSRQFEKSRNPDAMPAFERLEWRLGPAHHRVRAVELSRQHRSRPNRRHEARHVFKGKVYIGYLAAIVAAPMPVAQAAWWETQLRP